MITRKFENRLLIIAAVITAVGSTRGRNPCASNSENVDWLMDHCEAKLSSFHLICSGGLHDKWDEGSDVVRALTLCRWPEESFDPDELLSKFPALRSLYILDSNLTHLSKPFPKSALDLESVTFNGTNLEVLDDDAFSELPSLRLLDLRNNALSILDSEVLEGPPLERVYLDDNPWKCDQELSWILNMRNGSVASRVIDRDKLECKSWWNRPLVQVMEIIEQLAKQCLDTVKLCTCELTYVGQDLTSFHNGSSEKRKLMAFASVNCSSRGFTEMPESLPENTNILYLCGNRIRDLSPLVTSSTYKKVIDVYLDDNEIESIAVLEGSDWLNNFRVLSLRGNRLTDLPSYALENALQQNKQAQRINFGNNPWRCDCHFTPGFQVLLRRFGTFFKDVHDITCAKIINDENSDKQIKDLSRTSICASFDEYWLQPLDVLNVVLASLICFVFGKLLYDYWTFKKTGQLPWIVTKIP